MNIIIIEEKEHTIQDISNLLDSLQNILKIVKDLDDRIHIKDYQKFKNRVKINIEELFYFEIVPLILKKYNIYDKFKLYFETKNLNNVKIEFIVNCILYKLYELNIEHNLKHKIKLDLIKALRLKKLSQQSILCIFPYFKEEINKMIAPYKLTFDSNFVQKYKIIKIKQLLRLIVLSLEQTIKELNNSEYSLVSINNLRKLYYWLKLLYYELTLLRNEELTPYISSNDDLQKILSYKSKIKKIYLNELPKIILNLSLLCFKKRVMESNYNVNEFIEIQKIKLKISEFNQIISYLISFNY